MRFLLSLSVFASLLLIAAGCGGGSSAVEAELKKAGVEISRKGIDAKSGGKLTRVEFKPDGFKEDLLPKLEKMEPIHSLSFENCPLADSGITHIKGLQNLRTLDLRGTKITHQGVADLVGTPAVKGLGGLNLSATGLTDEAIPHLKKMTEVKSMNLHNNKITKEGFAELTKALPDTNIQQE